MTSVISFAYFTHFSNLNISRTNADICKSFLFSHVILCETAKKSRGKNLIIVALEVFCLQVEGGSLEAEHKTRVNKTRSTRGVNSDRQTLLLANVFAVRFLSLSLKLFACKLALS